jgi:hypothetical protein
MAETPKGRMMPVDREPSPGGNVKLFRRPDGSIRCEVLGPDAAQQLEQAAALLGGSTQLRKSHFVTCPQAGRFRRRR